MAHLRLTNSLSSPLPKKLVPFSSQSLILHHPFYFAKPKPLIRFARRTGPPLVLAAVGQAEPNHLPQTNAPQVRPEEEVFNSIINVKFRSNEISFVWLTYYCSRVRIIRPVAWSIRFYYAQFCRP